MAAMRSYPLAWMPKSLPAGTLKTHSKASAAMLSVLICSSLIVHACLDGVDRVHRHVLCYSCYSSSYHVLSKRQGTHDLAP